MDSSMPSETNSVNISDCNESQFTMNSLVQQKIALQKQLQKNLYLLAKSEISEEGHTESNITISGKNTKRSEASNNISKSH